jgi:hypothetical protein
MGWLVAQGWEITGITSDTSTTPATPYYALTKYKLNNQVVLQHLLNSFTIAENNARTNNETRYNEVVTNWTSLLDNTETYLDTQATQQTNHVTLFLANLDTYMDEVDALIAANRTQIVADAALATAALAELNTKLDDLETNYTAHFNLIVSLLSDADATLATAGTNLSNVATQVDDILTAMASDYTSVDTEINAILTSANSTLATHAADYNTVLATLATDYDGHALTATGFLDGLGGTELARINEKFAASLSTQLQQLTDRGLSSAAVVTDITARSARDQNEEIGALNDRLAREKWENQHRLYGQQVEMRSRTLDGKDRVHALRHEVLRYQASQIVGLHQLLQSTRDRTLAARTAMYQLRDANSRLDLDVTAREAAQRDTLLAQLQDAVKGILAGKESYASRTMQHASTLAEHKSRMVAEKMNVAAARLAGLAGKHEEDMKLMAYMLNERNQLLVGLYGFVEKRDDVAPKWESLAQMVAGLADAGGGWITP